MSWHQIENTWKRRTERWRERMRSLTRNRGRSSVSRRNDVDVAAADPARSTWDEAFSRVENYLGAHHLRSRELLNRRATEIIAEARRIAVQSPHEDPVQLSMHVLHLRIGSWMVRAYGQGDWADERFRAHGRLALLMANVARDGASQFLTEDYLPPVVEQKFRSVHLQPGPELRLSNMPPAPLAFIGGDTVAPAWQRSSRWAVARVAAVWIVAVMVLGAVTWAAAR